MPENRIIKKKDILPEQIRANIYDTVKLIVDFHGITRHDIEILQEKMKEFLPSSDYSLMDDLFAEKELSEYGERNLISRATLRRYLESESVVRFYSKDEKTEIVISRLFVAINLSYDVAHELRNNIELIGNLVGLFDENEYFEVDGVYLIKEDSIYCSSLYRMYQCFEKEMFGDVCHQLRTQKRAVEPESTETYNVFKYDVCEAVVRKTITKGCNSCGEEIYEGKMFTLLSYIVEDDTVNVQDVLGKLNDISFDIFMCHITEGFANDLIRGSSMKVKKGLNSYE